MSRPDVRHLNPLSEETPFAGSTAATLVVSKFRPQLNKRLIVLCDGTGQSAVNAGSKSYLTNITRLSRALSPYAVINKVRDDENNVIGGDLVEQVVYYQSGVGTEDGRMFAGGLAGVGVAQNVRAAYAFLAHNYIKDDQIYFFGFSRGAFTARLIAGLVTSLGILTKRGMDQFPEVYKQYQAYLKDPKGMEGKWAKLIAGLHKNEEIHESARNGVQMIGVFDTVAFYAEGRLLPWLKGELYKLNDIELSSRVKYGYHALALDEERRPFRPTLWVKPKDAGDGTYRLKEMQQVWFSGCHSDIGGGLEDPRLSDIALVWMISRCQGDDKLAFIDIGEYIERTDGQGSKERNLDYYLLDPTTAPPKTDRWATQEGSNMQSWMGLSDVLEDMVERFRHGPRPAPKSLEAEGSETEESLHRSIRDRAMATNLPLKTRSYRYLKSMLPWGHDVTRGYAAWPCKLLQKPAAAADEDSTSNTPKEWAIFGSDKTLREVPGDPEADKIEDKFRGRIRTLPLRHPHKLRCTADSCDKGCEAEQHLDRYLGIHRVADALKTPIHQEQKVGGLH